MARTATREAGATKEAVAKAGETGAKAIVATADNTEERLFQAITSKVHDLINDNADQIMASYKEAIELHNESDSDKKFKYKLPISISITGVDPNTYEIEAKLAYSVKRTDIRTALVKTGEDLVDQMQANGTDEDERWRGLM